MIDIELPENMSESQMEEINKLLDNLSESERDEFYKKYRENFMSDSDINKHVEKGNKLVKDKEAELKEKIEKKSGGKILYKDVLDSVIVMLDKKKTALEIENSLKKFGLNLEDCTQLESEAIIARQLKKEPVWAPNDRKKK